MVGNVTAVTVAPARMSAPSGQNSAASGVPAGKAAPQTGEALPGVRAAAAAAAATANQDLERALRKLNESAAAAQRNLSFRVDKGSGRTVITVVDSVTKEVIRQIPSEEVLAVSQALEATGGLIDAQA